MLILLLFTLILYSASALLLWRQLTRSLQAPWLLWLLPSLALLSHAALLWQYLRNDHFDHLNISTSLSTVAFLVALLSVLRGQRSGGLLLRPVIFIFAAASALIMHLSPADWGAALNQQAGLLVHIALSLLSYAMLTLATLYALQLLYLNYLLKHHRSNVISRHLPPLLTVERYFFRLTTTGTLLLLLALGAGFMFLTDMFAQGQAHKTILSSIAALMYLAVVIAHGLFKVRGKALVMTTVVASLILTLAYFGSRFVKDVLLSA